MVIEDSGDGQSHVMLGSTVVLKDLEYNEEMEYTIVGAAEANPMKNRISNESPVGAAVLGHKKGDVFEVQAPAGAVKYEVVDIK